MNRSSAHHNRIALKLISSKFTIDKVETQRPIEQLNIKAKIYGQEAEASAATIATLFGQKPAFYSTHQLPVDDYVLTYLYITARKLTATRYMDIFSTIILPFQLENQLVEIEPALHKEFSWQAPNCLPATIMNPVFFPYPVARTESNLVLSVSPKKHLEVCLFYLDLLRVPITPKP